MGIQDDAAVTCAAYRVTENGQTWYFTTSPGEELLDAAQALRKYCMDTEHSTGKFISLYSQAQPITPEEYQRMIRLRMENTGKITGVFDLDFDKREFSAVHIMNGWRTWAMRDVIPSIYQATSPRFTTADEQLRKLLGLLDGIKDGLLRWPSGTHPAQSSFGRLSRDDTVDLYSLSSHRLKQWGQLGEILGGVRFPEGGASHWSV